MPSAESRILVLQQLSDLQAVVHAEAKQLSLPVPETVVITAGSLHDRQGVWTVSGDTTELPRRIEIPIGPLALWSVFDLRCHVAHALLRPRLPGLVARLLLAQLLEYTVLLGARPNLGDVAPIASLWLRLGNTLYQLMHRWNLIADIETDRKVAKLYGQDAVTSWMQRWWVGENALHSVWRTVVLESALRGVAPPFLRDLWMLEPSCDDDSDDRAATSANTDSGDPGNADPHAEDPIVANLSIRMHVLAINRDTPSAIDPRHAIDPVGDRSDWERSVAAWALDRPTIAGASESSDGALRSIEWGEYPECVILPYVVEEVHRNAALFADKTLEDLPSIVQNAEASVPLLVVGSQLLDDEGKALYFAGCLESFLITELMRCGWHMDFVFGKQLFLRQTDKGLAVSPGPLVVSLMHREIDEDTFRRTVDLPGRSC